jgi:hypothetical protein
MEELGGWIFAIVAVLAVVLVRAGYEAKRSKKIRRTASEGGMAYRWGLDMETRAALAEFLLFQGEWRAKNVLRRGDGEVLLFGHEYVATSGHAENEVRRTTRRTVAAFRLGSDLPPFLMLPRFGHRLRALLGSRGVHERFVRRYAVRGEDEAATVELFRPEVLEYFAREGGWSVEGRGPWLLVWRGAKRAAAKDPTDFLHRAERVASLFRESAAS